MRRVFAFALATALLAGLPAAPGAAADREHQQMMGDIRMLQEQTQQLALMLISLSEALKTVTAKLDEQGGINRKAFADQKLMVDTVADGLRILREKVDDSNVRLGSLTQELEALRRAIPPPAPVVPPPPLEGGGAPQPGTPLAGADTTAPTQPAAIPPAELAAIPPGMSPQLLYERAWTDYTAGQWELAIAGFEAYIKTFPRSDTVDDAQFYIGEARLLEGKYQEAVMAYDRVIVNYPGSNSVPSALYKRGIAYERLNQPDRARQSHELVIKNFPDTDMADLARQALERLSKQEGDA